MPQPARRGRRGLPGTSRSSPADVVRPGHGVVPSRWAGRASPLRSWLFRGVGGLIAAAESLDRRRRGRAEASDGRFLSGQVGQECGRITVAVSAGQVMGDQGGLRASRWRAAWVAGRRARRRGGTCWPGCWPAGPTGGGWNQPGPTANPPTGAATATPAPLAPARTAEEPVRARGPDPAQAGRPGHLARGRRPFPAGRGTGQRPGHGVCSGRGPDRPAAGCRCHAHLRPCHPGPAGSHRLASLEDLSNLAAAEGILAPAEVKTAC